MRKCLYCDFLSAPHDKTDRLKYTHALIREIKYYGEVLSHPVVETVFIGGGTPTWLEVECMEEILSAVRSSFEVREDAEISMECNPGTVTKDALVRYMKAGVNRLSIGLQSANDEELKLLGRIHDVSRFYHTYELARRAGFQNINIDLMTGIPGQTVESLKATLRTVTGLRPEHLSVYDLIVEEGTPFYEMYEQDVEARAEGEKTKVLPDEDTELAMTLMVEEFLQKKGYHQYEISNFAREGKECQHNIGYWKRKEYLGVGLGAASLMQETRWSNERDLYKYMEACEMLPIISVDRLKDIDATEALREQITEENRSNRALKHLLKDVHELSRSEQMEEFMFLGLRINEGITLEDFEEKFNVSCLEIYGDVIRRYREQEILELNRGRLYLTDRGRQVGNLVFEGFLMD